MTETAKPRPQPPQERRSPARLPISAAIADWSRAARVRSAPDRRKTARKWQGREGGSNWRRRERASMDSKGSGDRWISVDLRKKGSPEAEETKKRLELERDGKVG